MEHQKQASCDQACQVHEHGATHGESKEDGNDARKGQTTIQICVSEEAKSLDVDKGLNNISECQKIQRYGPVGLELAPDFVQSEREVLTQSRRVKITNELPMGNSGNLLFPDVKAEQSDSLYICRPSGLPAYQENCIASSFPYFGNTRSEQKHFAKFNFGKKLENILPPNMELPIFDRHPFRHQIAGKSGYNAIDVRSSNSRLQKRELTLPPTEIHLQVEGTVQRQEQQMQPYDSPDKKVSSVPTFQGDLKGSTLNSVPCGFKSRGLNIRSRTRQKDEKGQPSFGLACKEPVANTRFTPMEDEHHNYHRCFTFLASDEMDKGLIDKASRNPSARKKDGVLQPNDNSLTDDFHFPVLVGEQGKRTKNISSRLPLSHSSTPAITAMEDLKYRHHSLQRMPLGSLHDVETLQICTTVDSVEGVPGRPPKLSKTTHHLLITKKIDVNLSKGDQMIRESTASAEFKGSSFDEMIALPPLFYSQGKDKAKFRHLGNSTDSEEKQDGNAITTGFLHIQKESPAETDTRSLGVNQSRSSLPGVISSPSHKAGLVGQNAENSLAAVASTSKEVRIRNVATELPDIQEELLSDLAVASSVDDKELSTLRTESLDVEHFLSHVEQPENSNFSPHQGGALGPGPSSRWVKRLRLSAMEPLVRGTKSSKIGDASPRKKVNTLFRRITDDSKMSSEPLLVKQLGPVPQQLDKTMMLLKNREFTMDSVKGRPDITASHSWIQRWCHRGEVTEQERRALQVVACEPENPNATLEEVQRKQFPSIAAMALMGKAVSNFRPCEFRKRGSLVVWNTEGF